MEVFFTKNLSAHLFNPASSRSFSFYATFWTSSSSCCPSSSSWPSWRERRWWWRTGPACSSAHTAGLSCTSPSPSAAEIRELAPKQNVHVCSTTVNFRLSLENRCWLKKGMKKNQFCQMWVFFLLEQVHKKFFPCWTHKQQEANPLSRDIIVQET
jgi:hypothetical protein